MPGARPEAPLSSGTTPVFRVRPRFSARLHLLDRWPFLLFLVAWGTLVVGGIVNLVLEAGGTSFPRAAPFALALGVLLPSIPLISLRLSWAFGQQAELVFHPHRLDASTGRNAARSVPLAKLRRVELAVGGRDGLGTILLDVGALDDGGSARIRMADVPHAAQVVDRIRSLLDDTYGPGGGLHRAA